MMMVKWQNIVSGNTEGKREGRDERPVQESRKWEGSGTWGRCTELAACLGKMGLELHRETLSALPHSAEAKIFLLDLTINLLCLCSQEVVMR